MNERIRAKEVRLVGKKGEQIGVMPVAQALDMARKSSLDLVEVAPTAVPPVCRLLDYGKFKYEQTKKEREARKSQKVVLLRELRIRPKIGDHDFDAKARSARKLLDEGNKVKLTVMFRGREITHPDLGLKLMKRMQEFVKEQGAVETPPGMDGRRLVMVLAPVPGQKAKIKEETKNIQDAKDQNS
ncbi:MAG: translation initiation factor IF-3 [Dehalococcoidales bacterium]|nr:translation initiation factor IF-3 [Dehalococcoidales bacterium]